METKSEKIRIRLNGTKDIEENRLIRAVAKADSALFGANEQGEAVCFHGKRVKSFCQKFERIRCDQEKRA